MSLSGSILLCCSGLFDIYIFCLIFSEFSLLAQLFLAIGYCHENVLYKVLTQNISGIVTDHVKFYP